jgi:hypothetical protein
MKPSSSRKSMDVENYGGKPPSSEILLAGAHGRYYVV